MRRIRATLLILALTLAGSWGIATADPEPAPAAPAQPLALITLTTIPNGWQERVDLRPVLEVYADGHAVKKPDAAAADRSPQTPPQQLTGSVGNDVLQAALTEIKALGAVDLGTPSVSDQGTQIIDLMPQAPDQDVHLIVYAPEVTDGLSTEQQGARKRFADLYRKLLDAFVKD
ncbi:hypothetical protein [Nocardia sp. NPDC050710]|uniref:hypothetical protein n=1 Tax=Nocardia sp. NPDC050710 TaxID=3157220 RepID=UPI00340D5B12